MISEELTGEQSGDFTQLRVWDPSISAYVDILSLLNMIKIRGTMGAAALVYNSVSPRRQ